MTLRSLEAAILNELRREAHNTKLRQKDIMEWSTGDVKPQGEEKSIFLPLNKVNVAYVEPLKRARKTAVGDAER